MPAGEPIDYSIRDQVTASWEAAMASEVDRSFINSLMASGMLSRSSAIDYVNNPSSNAIAATRDSFVQGMQAERLPQMVAQQAERIREQMNQREELNRFIGQQVTAASLEEVRRSILSNMPTGSDVSVENTGTDTIDITAVAPRPLDYIVINANIGPDGVFQLTSDPAPIETRLETYGVTPIATMHHPPQRRELTYEMLHEDTLRYTLSSKDRAKVVFNELKSRYPELFTETIEVDNKPKVRNIEL